MSNDFFAGLKARSVNLQQLTSGTATVGDMAESERIEQIPVEDILPNPRQPRRQLTVEQDIELADDIKQRGILQPIIVRRRSNNGYELVVGNRRLNAAKALGLITVPAIIRDYDDQEAFTVAIVENLQRKDLDPIDEAFSFKLLADEYNLSNRSIAMLIHKSPSYVDQRLRLLSQTNLTEYDNLADHQLEDTPQEAIDERVNFTQKLQNSQIRNKPFTPLRSIVRFQSFLDEAKPRLSELNTEKKLELAEQVRTLKKQIEELELEMQSQLQQIQQEPESQAQG